MSDTDFKVNSEKQWEIIEHLLLVGMDYQRNIARNTSYGVKQASNIKTYLEQRWNFITQHYVKTKKYYAIDFFNQPGKVFRFLQKQVKKRRWHPYILWQGLLTHLFVRAFKQGEIDMETIKALKETPNASKENGFTFMLLVEAYTPINEYFFDVMRARAQKTRIETKKWKGKFASVSGLGKITDQGKHHLKKTRKKINQQEFYNKLASIIYFMRNELDSDTVSIWEVVPPEKDTQVEIGELSKLFFRLPLEKMWKNITETFKKVDKERKELFKALPQSSFYEELFVKLGREIKEKEGKEKVEELLEMALKDYEGWDW